MVVNGVVMGKVLLLDHDLGFGPAVSLKGTSRTTTYCSQDSLHSRSWSKKKLQDKLMSIRQLIYYNTAIQAHTTIVSSTPSSIYLSYHPGILSGQEMQPIVKLLHTFIKPEDLQINLETKSKPGGQNGLIKK